MDIECRSCGSHRVKDLGQCRELNDKTIALFGGGHDVLAGRLYLCRVCNMVMRHPILLSHKIHGYYAKCEEDRWAYDFYTNGAWVAAKNYLMHHYEPETTCRILDIGANEGAFLNGLPTKWKKAAIEPSVLARQQLEMQGITVLSEFLHKPQGDQRAEFDVVTMFDVFEHLENPDEAIGWALDFLKPGGELIISTGDTGSWPFSLLGGDHWYYETPLHISFGNKYYFENLAERYKISLIEFKRISHRKGALSERIDDVVTTIYFYLRKKKSLFRSVLIRLVLAIPRYRPLMHKVQMPYAMNLKDHAIMIFKHNNLIK